MSDFHNKTIWITGASSGIGKALVQALDNYEVTFILSSRNTDELEALNNTLRNPNGNYIIPLDLGSTVTLDLAIQKVKELNLSVDFLFNNGGISQRAEAKDTSIDVDRRIFEVNYFGNIYLTKLVLPMMMNRKSGNIVVTSSIAGKFGFFLRSAYSASKHALHGYYESLRLEIENYGIQVTIVCPGKINTPISLSALNADGTSHNLMDHNQQTGMSADKCASKILKALELNKKEVLIGKKEILAVYLKRFLPQNLFWKIMKKQSAT